VGSFLEQHTDDLSFTRHPFTDRYELLGHYLSCDLQVIPSYYDGLPNVLLEAAGLGLPLLCSTAGGMGDLLADGEHGFLFHPGDEAGLQAALHRAAAATDKDLQRLSASCRALCQTYLTPEAETRGYLAVLRESAGRR
jgi:glycosyltransferase involved in cell wall biosynthesis